MLDSFFQWNLRIWTFQIWKSSGQKFRPRTKIFGWMGKLAEKTSNLKSIISSHKKRQFQWDDRMKQDSDSWMSKLLLEKRINDIGVEIVIFNKKHLNCKISVFFTSEQTVSKLQSLRKSIFVLWVQLSTLVDERCQLLVSAKELFATKLYLGKVGFMQ